MGTRIVDPARGEQTVALKEIPIGEVDERVRKSFLIGHRTRVHAERSSRTKYPAAKSSTPLYGQVHFENTAGPAQSSGHFDFVLDHSQGTPGTYDLFYFDENADGDLMDHNPHRPLRDRPSCLPPPGPPTKEEVWFEPVAVSFDFGPQGPHAIELFPRLWIHEDGEALVSFVPPTVRWGRFEVDGTAYDAFLGHWPAVTGRFDLPSTAFILLPQGGNHLHWRADNRLNAVHLLGDQYYRFSSTPTGDRLLVRPYEGPLEILELGAGGRTLKKLQMEGWLMSAEMIVAVGDGTEGGLPKATQRCRIPAGDYSDFLLLVTLGDTRLLVSTNRLHLADQGSSEPVSSLRIRADKPLVLDFPNRPEAMFLQPEVGQRVAPGDEVRIDTVLVDPILNVMIGRLEDMAHVEPPDPAAPAAEGGPYVRGLSLDPRVVITRANGRRIEQAVLPFG